VSRVVFRSPEHIHQITLPNPFDRFPDGWPRVPDDPLARMKPVTNDEARVSCTVGKQRIAEGRYISGQIDVSTWATGINDDFAAWRRARGG